MIGKSTVNVAAATADVPDQDDDPDAAPFAAALSTLQSFRTLPMFSPHPSRCSRRFSAAMPVFQVPGRAAAVSSRTVSRRHSAAADFADVFVLPRPVAAQPR